MNNPSGEVQEMIRHARIHSALHSVVAVAREIADYSGGADCPCSDKHLMGALLERLAMLDELISAPSKSANDVSNEWNKWGKLQPKPPLTPTSMGPRIAGE